MGLARWGTHHRQALPNLYAISPNINSISRPPNDDTLRIRRAESTAEYRAAAYLRAQAFSVFPEGQATDFARKSYLRMRGDEKWEEIEQAVKGTNPIVLPLIATTQGDYLPSLCIPREDAAAPEFIVGTLDINIGLKLPSEELIGQLPRDSMQAAMQRAYLSNVCVLEEVRRQGIAQRLIAFTVELALEKGVQHLYVHVTVDNIAARKLYQDHCGFEIESEEREATARALNRPKRLLLHRKLN